MSLNVNLDQIKEPLHKNYSISGRLEFERGIITHLVGENGVGKSSLIHTFKLYQNVFFTKYVCQFLTQKRLQSVNQITVHELFFQMKCFQNEELSFYTENKDKIASLENIELNALSGGQNQLVKILLASYLGGDIFFLDEPLLSLDKKHQAFFMNFLKFLTEADKYILMIEHSDFDFKELNVTKYLMELREGKLWIS